MSELEAFEVPGFEIFFDDLSEEAQKEFLGWLADHDIEEGDYDIVSPLAIVPAPEDPTEVEESEEGETE